MFVANQLFVGRWTTLLSAEDGQVHESLPQLQQAMLPGHLCAGMDGLQQTAPVTHTVHLAGGGVGVGGEGAGVFPVIHLLHSPLPSPIGQALESLHAVAGQLWVELHFPYMQ